MGVSVALLREASRPAGRPQAGPPGEPTGPDHFRHLAVSAPASASWSVSFLSSNESAIPFPEAPRTRQRGEVRAVSGIIHTGVAEGPRGLVSVSSCGETSNPAGPQTGPRGRLDHLLVQPRCRGSDSQMWSLTRTPRGPGSRRAPPPVLEEATPPVPRASSTPGWPWGRPAHPGSGRGRPSLRMSPAVLKPVPMLGSKPPSLLASDRAGTPSRPPLPQSGTQAQQRPVKFQFRTMYLFH